MLECFGSWGKCMDGEGAKEAVVPESDAKRELDLKEREVAAKELEAGAKAEEVRRSRWISPTVIALFAAFVGLVGNIVVARVNNANSADIERSRVQSNAEAERLRLQSNLVLEAIKTGDASKACGNLVFFVQLQLVNDSSGAIRTACAGTKIQPPSLPVGPGGDFSGGVISGLVEDARGRPVPGAMVAAFGANPVMTDDAGDFRIRLPSESHLGDVVGITIIKAGYATFSGEARVGGSLRVVIRVSGERER